MHDTAESGEQELVPVRAPVFVRFDSVTAVARWSVCVCTHI